MSGADFVFDGLTPWRPDWGLIECEVGPWLLDLHNFAVFLGYTFRSDGVLTLTWYHHQPSIGPPKPNLVVLDFFGVRGFTATQADDWDVRCSDDTDGWDLARRRRACRSDLRRSRQRVVLHGSRRAARTCAERGRYHLGTKPVGADSVGGMGRHHADAALQELERQYARSHDGRPMPAEVRAVVRSGYERADLGGRAIGIAVTAVGFAAAMLTFHRLRR